MRGLWLLLIPMWGCATGGDIATNGPRAFGGSGGNEPSGGAGGDNAGTGGSGTAWGGSAGTEANGGGGGSQSFGGNGGGSAGMSSGGTAMGGNSSGGMGGSGGSCECQPSAQETDDCGNCGTRVRTCGQDCQWGAWGSCGNEGPCAPGATQPGGCDSCSQQVCQNDCSWGACELKAGNECDWDTGHNRLCAVDSWQFCLSTCKWSTACEYNLTNANCCSGSGPRC